MKTKYLKVDPIIIYPACIKTAKKQDCFNCEIFKRDLCKSPRGMCAKKYPLHPKGCPNYGKYATCPPNAPMFDEIFDMNKDIYLIYYRFDIGTHIEKMKKRHPNWSERQLRSVLYWQGTAKKGHKEEIRKFMNEYEELGYEVCVPEGYGVDVTKTLANIGIILEWPPMKYSYRIAFAGIPKKGKSLKDIKKENPNALTNLY